MDNSCLIVVAQREIGIEIKIGIIHHHGLVQLLINLLGLVQLLINHLGLVQLLVRLHKRVLLPRKLGGAGKVDSSRKLG